MSGLEIPESWACAYIGLLEVSTGQTPKKAKTGSIMPFFKPGDIVESKVVTVDITQDQIITEENARMVSEGTVLVTCIGTLGKVCIAGSKGFSINRLMQFILTRTYCPNLLPTGVLPDCFVYFSIMQLQAQQLAL